MLRDQLIIADIMGTVAVLISTVPFFLMVVSSYRNSAEDKHYSYYGSLFWIYIVQGLISFLFMWFVNLWDMLAKNDDYKLQGAGKAFDLWWGDWEAGMKGATESLKGLYAYQGWVRTWFEAMFSILFIALPLVALIVATLRISQNRNTHKTGQDIFNQVFRAVLYMFGAMGLYTAYLGLISMSMHYPTSLIDMIHAWWIKYLAL